MAGRPKSEQGQEKRVHRMAIRWTKSEMDRLNEAKEKLGLPYDVDVARILTLQGVDALLGPERKNVAQ